MPKKPKAPSVDLPKTRDDIIEYMKANLTKEQTFEIFEAARITLATKQHDLNVERMRKASGEVNDSSTLVCFLYLLMRDEVAPGKLEKIMLSISNVNDFDKPLDDEYQLTNGWLGKYAQDIAFRLTRNVNTGTVKK